MARVLLGATGSVAAIRVPDLVDALTSAGHELKVVVTEPALYFLDPAEVTGRGMPLVRDADEWPGQRYARGDLVVHIELRKWAEVLVVAPLDANTLAKFALGLADNALTCVFRAWDFTRPVVLAPAMNTLMWDSPVTRRHLRQLLEDHGDGQAPRDWGLDQADGIFARHAPRLILVPPVAKRLACGDLGIGALAEAGRIAQVIQDAFAGPSPSD
jgi:phosphopantothenoylcysteine decarboxylase